MYQKQHRSLLAGLGILLLLAVSGCSETPGGAGTLDPGLDLDSDVQLSGQLVPSGGVSMNHEFILSGNLSPGVSELTSVNESFSLKLKPVQNQPVP